MRVIELADGRFLAWDEHGPADGAPVVFMHGTPSSRKEWIAPPGRLSELGIRVIAVDRPGYGLSTFQRDRRLADWPDDVRRLADHLALPRFAVIGASGGGPHALVCARFLADRISTAVTIGGVAPIDRARRTSSIERMGRVCARATWTGRAVFGLSFAMRARWPEPSLRLVSRLFPASDQELLRRADIGGGFLVPSSATAARAAAQDMALFARDWGFRLEDVDVPVHVWQGTDDFNVPFAHGEYLASTLPRATFHRVDGEGHMLLYDHLDEILEPLLS